VRGGGHRPRLPDRHVGQARGADDDEARVERPDPAQGAHLRHRLLGVDGREGGGIEPAGNGGLGDAAEPIDLGVVQAGE